MDGRLRVRELVLAIYALQSVRPGKIGHVTPHPG